MSLRGLLAVGLAALPGCGYSTGLQVAGRDGSIGVELFSNESLERDLERPLHDEVTRALRSLTDARLVDPARADRVVRGTVRTYQRRSGIRSLDNRLLETGVYVDAEAGLWLPGALAPERGPVRASTWVGYLVGPDENEREARDRALRFVAEQLVLDLFAPPR